MVAYRDIKKIEKATKDMTVTRKAIELRNR